MCIGGATRILAVGDDAGPCLVAVAFGDRVRRICLAYVPDAQVGEYVVAHGGGAVDRIDSALAAAICAALARAPAVALR